MTTPASSVQDALIDALERSDSKCRADRADRIRWASQYDINYGAIIGPVEAMNLLREARECFVDGHYIATLMLGTALVEHVVSEELISANLAQYGIPFEKAIKLASANHLFPQELLEGADRLRILRNPFAHRKPDDHAHTLGNRYLAQKRHPRLVAEQDAREALIIMYGVFRHALKGT